MGSSAPRRLSATGTRQPMTLVLGHLPLDHGQFPDLMPQRFRVVSRELRSAASAFDRFQRSHIVALVGGNQRSLVFLVAGLPATFLLRLAFRRLRPGVRMLRTGRQRGVLRRLPSAFEFFHAVFKLPDPVQQHLHEGPNGRRHLGFKVGRNRDGLDVQGRHSVCRPRKARSCPDQFILKNAPRA